MKLRKSNSKYDLSVYNLKCPICGRISKNNKCFADHIFHYYLNLNDEKHRKFAEYLRRESKEDFLKKAKVICPVCNKRFMRNLGSHFALLKNNKQHYDFLEEKVIHILNLFKNGYSAKDIENLEKRVFKERWILKIIVNNLGKEKTLEMSRQIRSKKRKNYWKSFSEEERKQMMKPVCEAEWKDLTPEQRKKHPWVIAGRKASLESTVRGSKNQKYAFELLKANVPYYNWIYNYAIDENWQIDIAEPKKRIFIEWDGRHHRVNIHGQNYLNNRKNRDAIKDKIIIKELNGCMIRIRDDGRFDESFVEEKVNQIIELLREEFENKIINL